MRSCQALFLQNLCSLKLDELPFASKSISNCCIPSKESALGAFGWCCLFQNLAVRDALFGRHRQRRCHALRGVLNLCKSCGAAVKLTRILWCFDEWADAPLLELIFLIFSLDLGPFVSLCFNAVLEESKVIPRLRDDERMLQKASSNMSKDFPFGSNDLRPTSKKTCSAGCGVTCFPNPEVYRGFLYRVPSSVLVARSP